ncbi:hypothetical protein [Streptomyces sp. NPDC050704]|uniref:hypothetical protein n=1 Tax=Streptomyces sp. NPDC050704 TaxID=3157219 RepID=UPI00341A033B
MRLLRTLCAAALVVLALAGCATATGGTTTGAGRAGPALPRTERDRDDLIRAAQRLLVERCLTGRGLSLRGNPGVPGTPGVRGAPGGRRDRGSAADRRLQGALFGRGRPELSITLATGYTVRAHTDGCLAAAQRDLYGDERRWFRTQVVVNNLRPEAALRMKRDPDYRAAHARWVRCAAPAEGARPEHPARTAAARCARESGLAEVRARLEPALLTQVRTERRDQLTTYRQLRTRALHRAAALYAARTVREDRQKGSTSS